jgi:hypothetical protein
MIQQRAGSLRHGPGGFAGGDDVDLRESFEEL